MKKISLSLCLSPGPHWCRVSPGPGGQGRYLLLYLTHWEITSLPVYCYGGCVQISPISWCCWLLLSAGGPRSAGLTCTPPATCPVMSPSQHQHWLWRDNAGNSVQSGAASCATYLQYLVCSFSSLLAPCFVVPALDWCLGVYTPHQSGHLRPRLPGPSPASAQFAYSHILTQPYTHTLETHALSSCIHV